MRTYILRALPIALLSLMFIPAGTTYACSVVAGWPPSAAVLAAQSDRVFAGTVQSVIQDKSTFADYRITFATQETDGSTDSVVVRAPSSSAACGYDAGYDTFTVGSHWVIFANKNAEGTLGTNAIGLNKKYDSLKEAVDAVTQIGTVTSSPTTDLTIGSRGKDVTWLQQHLIDSNAGTASAQLKAAGATGYFGALTRSALAEYQLKNGITPAAGYFGAKTRAFVSSQSVSHHVPTFSGTISAVDTACFADGICSVTIGGKKVIILAGLRVDVPPVGSLTGVPSIGDLESRIGATANVYATTTTEGGADYTLYGSTDYYVEVLADKPAGTPITVRGTIGCLPPKDTTGAVIALCAFGLKADSGTYYALSDTRNDVSEISSIESDQRVEITGTLRPGVAQSVFKGEGTIEIDTLKKI